MSKWIRQKLNTDDLLQIGKYDIWDCYNDVYIGGAGNKMLCVAEGIAHCYVYPSAGKDKILPIRKLIIN